MSDIIVSSFSAIVLYDSFSYMLPPLYMLLLNNKIVDIKINNINNNKI